MDSRADRSAEGAFSAAKTLFEGLKPDQAGDLIAASADVALVLDRDGTIQDAAFGSDDLLELGFDRWTGQSWFDVVTSESRGKLDDMLKTEATYGTEGSVRWRQVTHPVTSGGEVPIRYATVSLPNGRVLAIGRNMQAVASLQQRLVEAQLSMEREYARMRRAETRYRLLFQLASEAIVIVDAASHKVVEANPKASEILGREEKKLVGTSVATAFDGDTRQALQDLMNRIREGSQDTTCQAVGNENKNTMVIGGSLFRQDGSTFFLLRLSDLNAGRQDSENGGASLVASVVENAPEGFVVTDMAGDILRANEAFLDMVQIGAAEQLLGRPVGRWIGRSSVDLNVLMANLKEHGTVRLFTTALRNEFGGAQDVEISAVAVPNADVPCIGFMIRGVEGRLPIGESGGAKVPRSIEQLSQLVGRVPLKDLVQESTDIIERLCIEAALELTGDNRASAAEMLGLSRQSLYVKLRRHGLGQRG